MMLSPVDVWSALRGSASTACQHRVSAPRVSASGRRCSVSKQARTGTRRSLCPRRWSPRTSRTALSPASTRRPAVLRPRRAESPPLRCELPRPSAPLCTPTPPGSGPGRARRSTRCACPGTASARGPTRLRKATQPLVRRLTRRRRYVCEAASDLPAFAANGSANGNANGSANAARRLGDVGWPEAGSRKPAAQASELKSMYPKAPICAQVWVSGV